jgi:uncharacterized membrane protein
MAVARHDFWFRPKRYGYGAEPANWKGWLATGAYLAVVAALTWPLMIQPALDGATLPVAEIAVWAASMVVLTLAFMWLCRIKSDGVWRWRWGTRD